MYRQLTTSKTISPKRGTIYDSTGKALAISAQVDTVSIDPTKIVVENDDEEVEKVMKVKEEKKGAFNNKIFLEYVDEEKRNLEEEKELNKEFRK